MKVIGKLSELVKVLFRQNTYEITLDTNTDTTYTANRTVLLPEGDQNDTIVGRISSDVGADRLQNKELSDDNVLIVDPVDTTKKARIDVGGITTGTTRAFSVPDANTTLVGTDTTQTLTGKTLTSPKINEDVAVTATATEINKLDGLTADTTELNYVDGVTSAIQTQLDSKEPTITGGTTAQYLRGDKSLSTFATDVAATAAVTANTAKVSADGSIGTHSDVDVTTSAPVSGDFLTWDGSNWVPGESTGGGSGSGEVNFNDNPNAVLSVDGNNTDDVGDYIAVEGGTGGATGVTVARTTTALDLPRSPYQTTGIKFTFAAGTDDYVRLRFRVPPADRGKKLKIEWAQLAASYVAQTGKVELYNYSDNYVSDVAEVALHGDNSSGDSYIPNQTGVYYNEFDADDREYYELRIVNAGATAGTITINDFVIGPGKLHSGAVVTAWEAFDPIITNSDGMVITYNSMWRRVGDSLEANIKFSTSVDGTSSSGIFIGLPSGLTVDSTRLSTGTTAGSVVGHGFFYDSSANTKTYYRAMVINTSAGISMYPPSGSSALAGTTIEAGDGVSVQYTVPIAEWAGSGVLNVITQDNLTELTSYTPGNANWTFSSTAGKWHRDGQHMVISANAVVSSASGTLVWSAANLLPSGYTVDTSNLILSTGDDKAVVGYAYIDDTGTQEYGCAVTYDNSSGGFILHSGTGTVAGSVPFTWASGDSFSIQIRVPITEFAGSQSSLVGFSHATEDQNGLVKRNKWQRKTLAADVTADTTLSDLTFSNLVTGKTYRVSYNITGNTNTTDDVFTTSIEHNSTTIAHIRIHNDGAADETSTHFVSAQFVAAASTVTFTVSGTSVNAVVRGNGTYTETWAMLEELDNYGAESSDF